MEKMSKSIVYSKLKGIFLFLCSCFEKTFFCKLFFGKVNENVLSDSLFGKIFFKFKKALIWIYEIVSDVFLVKLIKKIFSFKLTDIISGSAILKWFHLNDYDFTFPFVMCLGVFFLSGIMPTMVVAGLCIIIFLLMFFDENFKNRIGELTPIASDMFVFFYLIALFHGRNISIDYQRNSIFLIYFVFVGIYFVFRYYMSSVKKVKAVLSSFTVSGLIICAYGLLQFVTGSYKTTTWTDTQLFSDIEGRLVSTFENPNVFGEYLLILIPLAIVMFFITDKLIWRIIYGGVFLSGCACMILTYSRGCWIGLILGIALLVIMLYPKLLLPLGIAAPFSLFFIPESIITRITSIGNLQDGSTAFRVYLWKATLNMVKDIWHTGIGLGTASFAENYRPYSFETIDAPHSHNTFLHVICESGLFGLVVFVLLLYFIIRQLMITYKEAQTKTVKMLSVALTSGLLGLTVQAMFDNTLYNYRMYMLFFAILAASASLYSVRREKIE